MNKSFAYLALFAPLAAQARIAIIENNSDVFEIPRSQTKTYLQIQTGSIEQNLKPVRAAKPGAMSEEELATIPERYLPPELQQKQREIKARLEKTKEAKKAQKLVEAAKGVPAKDGEVVKIRGKKNKIVDLRIDEAVWVPPTAATDDAILAPQRMLPDVELLQGIDVETSGKVKKEIRPGETREMTELFASGKTTDPSRTPLLPAFNAYADRDYATAVTLALGVMSDPKASVDLKVNARYVLAHSLFQAGFYASALPHLVELVPTKWRRSVIGIAAQVLEKTRDDGAANQILANVSLSQIPEEHRPLFSFHLGRILLNTGARDAAFAAFKRVPLDHTRYPEAQYFMGVIRAAEVENGATADDWDKKGSAVSVAREYFDTALLAGRTAGAGDLMNLIKLSLARLAYQSKQYNQSIYNYNDIPTDSPFAREAAYETAWSLYRIAEYNRSLGVLHPLGSAYFESRDLPELWILRSLNYLKLCRFDESKRAANQFETVYKALDPELAAATSQTKALQLASPSDLEKAALPEWIREILLHDPVVRKDFTTEDLLKKERSRLATLATNLRVQDAELRSSSAQALEKQLDKKIQAVANALKPYLVSRIADIQAEYKSQKERLDFLRFEIYSQATRFPKALERPEAHKLIAKGEFLPGVFLKGHEILWRFTGEYWSDELRGYDYFMPTECKGDEG